MHSFRWPILKLIVTIIVLLIITEPAYANQELTFDIERTTYTKADKTTKPTIEKGQIVVILGHSFLSYSIDTTKVIYDFSKRRIYRIDTNSKSYSNDSLYTDIGFRTYEFRNRLMLGDALSAADVKDNPMPKTLSEHLFSLQAKDSKTALIKDIKNDEVVFSWQGNELLAYSKNTIDVGSDYNKEFIRFVRYYLGGHPEILTELQKTKGIPSTLRLSRYDMDKKVIFMNIASYKTTPDTSYTLAGLKEAPINNSQLTSVIARIGTEPSETMKKQADSLLAEANHAFSQKQYLDTMLTYLEYTLETGLPLPAQFQGQRDMIVQDSDVKDLLASITPYNEEEAKTAIKTLKKLQTHSKNRQHVLMIFEANIQTNLEKPEIATELFLKVLNKNPYIVGVWTDIGDLYFQRYDTITAWRCWDIARSIQPNHKQLASINQFEQKLVSEYPEFF